MKSSVINYVLFQIGWLVCVVCGDLYALVFTAIAILIHHFWVMRSRYEYVVMVLVAGVGIAWDTFLTHRGILIFTMSGNFIPVWLCCLWVLFSSTLNHSFSWMHNRLWLAVIFGVIFGPISYLAAIRMEAAQMAQPLMLSMMYIAVGWGLIFPLSLWGARKCNYG